jgi:hypothetical protein
MTHSRIEELRKITKDLEKAHEQYLKVMRDCIEVYERYRAADLLHKAQCSASTWERTREDEEDFTAIYDLLNETMREMNFRQQKVIDLQTRYNTELGLAAKERWSKNEPNT